MKRPMTLFSLKKISVYKVLHSLYTRALTCENLCQARASTEAAIPAKHLTRSEALREQQV
jgi:hypothetical protein